MYRSPGQVYWKEIYYVPRPFAIALANISYISSSLIVTTLAAFISVPIFVLKELIKRLDYIYQNQNKINPIQLSLALERWRKHHELTCSLVDSINFCFGPCLLTSLMFASNVFIRYSSMTIIYCEKGSSEDLIGSYILQVVVVLVHFLVLVYPSQILKIEVITHIENFFRLR